MPKCAICEQDKQEGREKKIYTARILEQEQWQTDTITHSLATYGEFQMHSFFICANCHTRDKIILSVGGAFWGLLSLILFILAIAIKQYSDLIAMLCAIVFMGGPITWALVSIDVRLTKKAKQERGNTDRIKVFTEKGYEELLRDNQPQQ